MKNKILLIRSVSMQQLDKNLPDIYKSFPDHELYILTHSHNIKNCKKYKGIRSILDYKKKGSFNPFYIDKDLINEKFDTVIFFVSNIEGHGFLNVSLLAQRLTSRSVLRCNLNSKIKRITKIQTFLALLKTSLIFPLSAILSIPLIPINLFFLILYSIKSYGRN